LRVGGLAVTCNLTLPVACAASAAANEAGKGGGSQPAFAYSKYTGWPGSLMSGDLQAPICWRLW
jgi:NitT/TauT family transport system substrate-binding protein